MDLRTRLAWVATTLLMAVAPAAAVRATAVTKPDLVVEGVTCASAARATLFSFSLHRSGEATFNGMTGVRELGERSTQLQLQAAEKVLKLAGKMRHRRDRGVPEEGSALCVRLVQQSDTRPHVLWERGVAWDFLNELQELTPLVGWVCPGRQVRELFDFCARWYRRVFRASWQECSSSYDAMAFSDGTVVEVFGERPAGSDAAFTRTASYASLPREGMERIQSGLRDLHFSGEYIIAQCVPLPCPDIEEPPYTQDPKELQAFWDLVHQHVPFERRPPRGEAQSCPRVETFEERVVAPNGGARLK